jgi:hypothetical protein
MSNQLGDTDKMVELKKEFEEKFPKHDKNDFRCFADELTGDKSGCVNDRSASCYGETCFYKDANDIYHKEECKHYHLSNEPLYYPPEEFWQWFSIKLEEARTDERARIVTICDEIIFHEQADALYPCGQVASEIKSKIEAITADQPTCEGCEHHYHSFPNKKEHPCTQCDEDFSNYQARDLI